MTAIFSAFWQICIFRTGPEVIPASQLLLGLLLIISALVSWAGAMVLQAWLPVSPEVSNQLTEAEIERLSSGLLVFTRVVVGLACTAALIAGLLAVWGYSTRITKTLTAVYGTDIIITTLTVLGMGIGQLFHPMAGQLAITSMFFWNVSVLGFILHKALEISWGFGIVAAIFLMVLTFAVTQVALAPG